MNLDDVVPTFLQEGRELLDEAERELLSLSRMPDDPLDRVNAVFRAAHTIKGSAGLFGLDTVVGFTHDVESVLDRARGGLLKVEPALIDLLLACMDHIRALLDQVVSGEQACDADLAARGVALQSQLTVHLVPQERGAWDNLWQVSLRLDPDVLRHGLDPLPFLRYLGTLGTIEHIDTVFDAMPDVAAFDAECAYIGVELSLRTDADQEAIESVFEFMRDSCVLRIVPPARGQQDAPSASLPAPGSARPGVAGADTPRGEERRFLRVDADKLDRLIDLVGELITLSASAQSAARRIHDADLQESHSALASLVESVRDSALALRMVRIGASFNRFQRVVHDVAQELGKDIELVISGEDTELDKSVVDHIADPLTHLVRNAIDHGIESAAVRAARGKPARGQLRLNAYHDAGGIVIDVADDGGGLDRDRILAKAIERGLADPARAYSDDDVHALIFEPGFSTAQAVTNLSGRGVGMDVVKRNIADLRGAIALRSRPGQGATVSIRLPLTLAIIEGFQVTVGASVFVLPLDTIDECIAYSCDGKHDYTDLRGEVLPFIRLRDAFALGGNPAGRQNIVVVRHAGLKAGLVVDDLLGECQAVIKPLGALFKAVPGISGSSIGANGDVVLILDVPELIARAAARGEAGSSALRPVARLPLRGVEDMSSSLPAPILTERVASA
ncbi:chemotaxis protein CheA [Pigmentiphaga litoralis]|uniref:chemotaxis protein CheA n=1 Tax=Pigmentiphaga litoralis TaxID=516702 RepID=UPI00167A687C|nr:chemotaxis protein CheA [Pigmentiphaga litoralis]GGX12876.1 chemotaxis protein CheA [Pigmentiphaga litoralis]